MKAILGFLRSLSTAVWLLLILLVLLLAGAFIMPAREEFEMIHSLPLFRWIIDQELSATWWLWGAVGVLAVMAANTLTCSIDSVVKKRSTRQWLLIVSPQIIHLGFLFMLVAHLVTGLQGFKGMAVAAEGMEVRLPNDLVVRVSRISVSVGQDGSLSDWAVDIAYRAGGTVVGEDRLRPNSPSFRGGIGIYVKDLRPFPQKLVLLEISREPGALWALIGGVLFMVGTVALIGLKTRRDAPIGPERAEAG